MDNLPGPLTPLVGRAHEAAAVAGSLRREDVRLVTLTGTGGIGKTRLAIEAARRAAAHFRDGAVFISLGSAQSPDLVMPLIGETFGLRDAGQSAITAQLTAHLRPCQILLVLDNFEQLVEAGPQLSALLAECPGVKCLVTSRVPLRISCEHQHPVPTLALPDPRALDDLGRLAQVDSIQLFLLRARAARPDFQLTAANAAVITAICLRLEGLPLAVELAAALVRVLPLQAILSRLDHRLLVLVGGPRDLPARQQTLRTAIAWSYDLLPPAEQRLFRILAVLLGAISADIVQAMLDALAGRGGPALDLNSGLAALVDHNLLRLAADDDPEPRYSMLETIREFGLERLEAADETAAARAAHAQAMLSLAEAGAQGLRTGRQEHWLSHLGQNHDNLRAALGWLADQGENTALLRLTAALGRFWYMHGHLSEGLAWVERALSRWEGQRARWQSAHPPVGFAENERQAASALAGCLNAGGLLARYQCDYRRTVELCEESLRYCRMLADPRGITTALEHLAAVARTGGNHTAAQAMYAESLAICRKTGDELGTAWTTLYIAIANWFAGDLDLSLQLTQDALASFRRIGAQWETASALVVCAAIHRDRKEYESIDQLAEEALHIKLRMGDQIGIGLAQNILGENRMVLNDHTAALLHLREAITIFEEVGSRNNYASTIRILAELTVPWFPDRAVQLLAVVETVYRAINYRPAAVEREEIDNRLADLRARLPEGQFSDSWAAGSALPPAALSRFIDDTIDLALRETARESTAEPAKPNPYKLTAREIEVLGLIAGGLTDADAAARLVISRRTVSTHMTSIFNKLGVSSRLAAVRVALDQKLIEGVEIRNFRDHNP